jgi:phosphate transport system substrate-binding protein
MVLRILFAAFAANLAAMSNAIALDPGLPAYETTAGVSGKIKSVGSDTLDREMLLWAKAFMGLYPDVKIEVEGKGSATAPPALVAGVSQLGPMSRPMSAEEADGFEKQYGAVRKCVEIKVARSPVRLRLSDQAATSRG